MKLACFTMFRNEVAMLPPFLDQIEFFFDHGVMLNHGSNDGGPAYVRSRKGTKIELFHLKAPGYPQSAVATRFARHIMTRHEPDFLFFLDCDEFLPFSTRSEMEEFLSGQKKHEALLLRWLNICPTSLEGGNIFAAPFWQAPEFSRQARKVVLTRRIAGRSDLVIHQGYHWLTSSSEKPIDMHQSNDWPLYHIPVLSRPQFYFKIALGAETLRQERINLRSNRGWHWIDLDHELASNQLSSQRLTRIALSYSEVTPDFPDDPGELKHLDFSFPYIHSPYSETAESQAGQVRGLVQQFRQPEMGEEPGSYTVVDDQGGILFSSGGPITAPEARMQHPPLPMNLLRDSFAEHYAALIEPLFCLPVKSPESGWTGHIPFLFVLMRMLRPATYVELGVASGASLIAAASAANTYQLSTMLVGIDSWEGDEHAGFYGEDIYRNLCTFFSETFPRVRLERGFFADVLPKFATGSIDILHIDGLHTYDAVKDDFMSWFDRVSPTGVIIMHDTAVHDRGFGVFRLWNELKEHFTTIEFQQSFGLGVVILSPEDERLKPLMALARDREAMRAYEALVADIARVLPERMKAREGEPEKKRDGIVDERLAAVYNSTSWRITAPLRRLGDLLRPQK
jgi:predicted O-methyltransferase YrrM